MLNPNQSYLLFEHMTEEMSPGDVQKVMLAVIDHLGLYVTVNTDYTGAVAFVEVKDEP